MNTDLGPGDVVQAVIRTRAEGDVDGALDRIENASSSDRNETHGMDLVRVVEGRLVEHWFFAEPGPGPGHA